MSLNLIIDIFVHTYKSVRYNLNYFLEIGDICIFYSKHKFNKCCLVLCIIIRIYGHAYVVQYRHTRRKVPLKGFNIAPIYRWNTCFWVGEKNEKKYVPVYIPMFTLVYIQNVQSFTEASFYFYYGIFSMLMMLTIQALKLELFNDFWSYCYQ